MTIQHRWGWAFGTLAALLLCNAAHSQPGSANTKGICSPAISGNNNKITLHCDVDAAEGRRIVELLNKMLSHQINPSMIISKLDEIIADQARNGTEVSAPNGIAAAGSTLINPTVNNFGPPPATITIREEPDTDPALAKAGLVVTKIHLATDRPIPGAIIGVVLSDVAEIDDKTNGMPAPMIEGVGISEVGWALSPALSTNGTSVPNSFRFIVDAPAAFQPGMDLVVVVRSKPGLRVLAAVPVER